MTFPQPNPHSSTKIPVAIQVTDGRNIQTFRAPRSGTYAVIMRVSSARLYQVPAGTWAAALRKGPSPVVPAPLRVTWNILSSDGRVLFSGPQNGVEGTAGFGPGLGDMARSYAYGLQIGSVSVDGDVEYQFAVQPADSFDPEVALSPEVILHWAARQAGVDSEDPAQEIENQARGTGVKPPRSNIRR